jgi:hypothetical protein
MVGATLDAIPICGMLGPILPKHICLDKGYDYDDPELEALDRGVKPHIRRRGEPPLIGHVRGKPRRWVVERTNSWQIAFAVFAPAGSAKLNATVPSSNSPAPSSSFKPSRERPTGHDGSLLAPLSPLVRILGSTSERGFSSHLGRPVYTDAAQWSPRKLFIGVRTS